MDKDFLKIGHRGACGYEPENTLISFKKAMELGVDMVELDVYTLQDGRTIVSHDLPKLNTRREEKIPTLREVLDLIDKKIQVNIELKATGTAQAVAEIIETYIKEKGWSYNDFLISSFNYHELKKFKDLKPEVKIGILISGLPFDYAKLSRKLGAYSINLNKEIITQELIDDIHKRGLKVFVWIVNDKDEIKKIKALGVDGIFSDYPDRL